MVALEICFPLALPQYHMLVPSGPVEGASVYAEVSHDRSDCPGSQVPASPIGIVVRVPLAGFRQISCEPRD